MTLHCLQAFSSGKFLNCLQKAMLASPNGYLNREAQEAVSEDEWLRGEEWRTRVVLLD